jgi:hypothetical protein
METRHTRLQQFLHILRIGYRQADAPTPDIHRQHDVMRAVRHLGPLNATPDTLEFMNQVAWRFASAAGVGILAVSVYVAILGWSPETGVVSQFFENPVGFLLMQAIGGF